MLALLLAKREGGDLYWPPERLSKVLWEGCRTVSPNLWVEETQKWIGKALKMGCGAVLLYCCPVLSILFASWEPRFLDPGNQMLLLLFSH